MTTRHDPLSPAVDAPAAAPAVESPPVSPTRLCNRCRKSFDHDEAQVHAVVASWWLCPPCRATLVGGTGRGRQS